MKKKHESQDENVPNPSRRKFFGRASCAAVGATAIYSTVLDLGMFNALAACGVPDHKALVCLFQFGGNDSFNTLTPYEGSETQPGTEYYDYVSVRGGVHDPDTNPGELIRRPPPRLLPLVAEGYGTWRRSGGEATSRSHLSMAPAEMRAHGAISRFRPRARGRVWS